MSTQPRPASAWTTVALVVGLVGHLVVGVFYLAIGLVAPLSALPFFWAFWVFLLVMAVRRRTNPAWVLATPVVAAGALFAGAAIGEAVFGWTA